MASLVFGTDPWQHRVLSHRSYLRRPDLPTLAEALSALGYETLGFFPLRDRLHRYGFFDGFDRIEDIGSAELAAETLAEIGGRRLFVWIHLPFAEFPYLDHRGVLPRLATRPEVGDRVDGLELMAYTDPDTAMPDDRRRAAFELYRHSIAWGDHLLGRLLEALKAGGGFDDTLIVVTALHGSEMGEHGQALYAQSLVRETIEVPLVLRLPPGLELDVGAERLATARLWATLVEAAGGRPMPVHLPSLRHPSSSPILSSLYAQGTSNHFSLVECDGDAALQMSWRTEFAAEEPAFFELQQAEAGRRDLALPESPRQLRARLDRLFRSHLPWSPPTDGSIERRLLRWSPAGDTAEIEDGATLDRLAAALERRLSRFVDRERSVEEEDERWAPRAALAATGKHRRPSP